MACCFNKTNSTILVVCLTAALCRELAAASNQTQNFSSPMPGDRHLENHLINQEASNASTTGRTTTSEMQPSIHKEDSEDGKPMDCCPSIEEMIEPQGGRNLQDGYVELYRDGENAQRFFEYSCRPDVVDKPCRFIDSELQAQSRCVQKYSYSYAIIKTTEGEQHRRHRRMSEQSPPQQQQERQFPDNGSISSWTLDYIKVRSGCSCEVSPKPRKS